MAESPASSLLSGVRVLDFGRLMPSAVATFELAKLGADVIKVEQPPGGDYLRGNEPRINGRGDIHLDINRNKRSLGLDFRSAAGRQVAHHLVQQADVLVELSRPGTMAKFGLDWPTVHELNPALVYCSFSAYGQDGPYAKMPAHGLSADAVGGALMGTASTGAMPDTYTSIGPWAAGLYAATTILAAVLSARQTGVGHYLDATQAAAVTAYNFREIAMHANPVEGDLRTFADLGPRYACYATADDKYLLFTATEPKLWNAFCAAVGRPDLQVDSAEAMLGYSEDENVRGELAKVFGSRTRDEWITAAMSDALPVAPVLSPGELHEDPQNIHREMVVRMPHPLGGEVVLSGHPLLVEGRGVAFRPAPEYSADSREVLAEMGYPAGEVDALVAAGTVVEWRAAGLK
jgi:alpha-methylacyl-CoA racemase